MRALAASTGGVWSLDLDRRICPFLPICDPLVDGLVPRLDDNHITVTFGRTLRTAVEQFLNATGYSRHADAGQPPGRSPYQFHGASSSRKHVGRFAREVERPDRPPAVTTQTFSVTEVVAKRPGITG